MTRTIKISGAGIAGLTAAINLAGDGFNVLIYEKGKDAGVRFNEDFQGLENWSTEEDILDILNNINIKTNFHYKAFTEADLIDDALNKYKLAAPGSRAGIYMVQRGTGAACLDQCLKDQALDAGVEIRFNRHAAETEADIVATGPRFVGGIVFGLKGIVDSDDRVVIMLDDNSAPKGYVYGAIIGGRITLASVIMQDFVNARNYFKRALEKIQKIYELNITDARTFSGIGNFIPSGAYNEGGRLLAGERAGFQDYLFGFGMRYAFLSGYFAARSIIEDMDYDSIIKRELLGTMRSSLVNRYLLEKLGNTGYRMLIKRWVASPDPVGFLKSWYGYSWYKRLTYPIALRWYERHKRR